jgi:hypothetical protein
LVFVRVSSMIGICQSVFHGLYLSECLPWLVFVRMSSMITLWQIPIMEDTLTNTNHGRHSDKYQLCKTFWQIPIMQDILTNTNHGRHWQIQTIEDECLPWLVFVRMSCIIGICQSVFYGLYLSECLPGLVFVRVSTRFGISQSVTNHGRHSDKYKP